MLLMAAVSSIAAYVTYFRDIRRDTIRPNRWSWLVWSVATSVEAATYEALNTDIIKSAIFFLSGLSCIVITALIWKRARWEKPNWTEIVSTVTSMIALVLWLVYKETFWAHVLVIIAVPIAFFPTWEGAKSGHENSRAWLLWSVGDLATLAVILLRIEAAEALPYIVVEATCHISVWRMSARKR